MIRISHCPHCPTQALAALFCRRWKTTTSHRTRMMNSRGQGQPRHLGNRGSPLRVSRIPAPLTSLHTNRSSRCYPMFDLVEKLTGTLFNGSFSKIQNKIDGRASTLSTWTLNVHMGPASVVSLGPRACGGLLARTSQRPQSASGWGPSMKSTKLTPEIGKTQVVCVWDGRRMGSS